MNCLAQHKCRLDLNQILFLLSLLLISTIGFAQPDSKPILKSSINTTSGTIGQKFDLVLTIESPTEHSFQITTDVDLSTTWTQASEIKQNTIKEKNLFKTTVNSIIVPFETGHLKTPNYVVSWITDKGTTESVTAPQFDVNINSVLDGKTTESMQLKNIKSPVTLPFPLTYLVSFWILLAIIIALVFAVIFRRIFKKIREIYSPREPHLEALFQLEQIQKEHLIEHKKYKEYYTKISFVIRHYIGAAYNIDSEEKTSYELLELLKDKQQEELMVHKTKFQEAIDKITKLLNESDMVKFAKATPDITMSKRSMDAASEIVNLTSYKFDKSDNEITTDTNNG